MGLQKFSIEEVHHEHPRTADTQRRNGSVPKDLFEVMAGATACSLRVFHGLLAWANQNAQITSKPEITTP